MAGTSGPAAASTRAPGTAAAVRSRVRPACVARPAAETTLRRGPMAWAPAPGEPRRSNGRRPRVRGRAAPRPGPSDGRAAPLSRGRAGAASPPVPGSRLSGAAPEALEGTPRRAGARQCPLGGSATPGWWQYPGHVGPRAVAGGARAGAPTRLRPGQRRGSHRRLWL